MSCFSILPWIKSRARKGVSVADLDFEEGLVDEEMKIEDEMKVEEKVDQNGEEDEGVEPQISEPLPAALATTQQELGDGRAGVGKPISDPTKDSRRKAERPVPDLKRWSDRGFLSQMS